MKPKRNNQVGASNNSGGDNRIEFVAPTDEMIDLFARKVCEGMKRVDCTYTRTEIRQSLTNYLKVVMSIAARRKNEEQAGNSDQFLDIKGE